MLPANSPISIPSLICSTCGAEMRVQVQKVGKGMVSAIHAFCDTKGCEYGQNISFQYVNTMGVVPYKAPEKEVAIPSGAPKFTMKQERPEGETHAVGHSG